MKKLKTLLPALALFAAMLASGTVFAEEPVTVRIPVSCSAKGLDEEFTYTITPWKTEHANPNKASIKLVDGQTSTFKITIDYPGTYSFVIKQLKGDTSGVKYDRTEYEANVYVTEDDDGKMEAWALAYADGSDEKVAECSFKNVGPAQPSTESDQPSTESEKPSTESNQPSTESNQPSTESNQPSTESNQPSTESNQPSTESNQPSTESNQPSTESNQPSTESNQPSTESNQPSTESNQPSTESNKPSTESNQPSTESNQPSTESNQPSTESQSQTNSNGGGIHISGGGSGGSGGSGSSGGSGGSVVRPQTGDEPIWPLAAAAAIAAGLALQGGILIGKRKKKELE